MEISAASLKQNKRTVTFPSFLPIFFCWILRRLLYSMANQKLNQIDNLSYFVQGEP